MLELTTQMALGGKRYNGLIGGIRGTWNLLSRQIEVHIAPARKQGNGDVLIGTRETGEGSSRVMAPQTLLTLTLQDSNPPDPAYTVVLQRLQDLIEAIETIIVTHPSLQDQSYQLGEDEYPLECTFTPYEPNAFQFEERVRPTRGG